mmetsp:Transcript_103154/g.292229  ORF Transcript_103154/g.292229 Transcript_103154/m.292229 type:complete len:192 (+) Transcript_103154:114-689(+)
MEGDETPMPDVVTKVLASFQEPKFAGEVETLLNINIPTFAVATQDGSYPIEWQMQHKKYKALYENKIQSAVSECGADITNFMTYMEQCNQAYGHDANFQNLMAVLTASEDFSRFCQLMFEKVRENWEPEPDVPAPPPNVQIHQVDVVVPEGVAPGMAFNVEYLGLLHPVAVPEGCGPGTTLRASLQVPVPT